MADEPQKSDDQAAVGSPCPACQGRGVAADGRYHCWHCYGTGKVQEKKYYWNLGEPTKDTSG